MCVRVCAAQPVEAKDAVVRAWVMMNGTTLCVDQRFEDNFGLPAIDCIGRPFKDLVMEQDEVQE